MNFTAKMIELPSTAGTQILDMDRDTVESKPAADKWSGKEIIGHLIDSASNNYMRFMQAITSDSYCFSGYDQDDWVTRNNYQERPLPEIIMTWMLINSQFYHVIKNTDDELLKREVDNHNFDQICMHPLPGSKKATLAYLLEDYLRHMEHHIAQVIPGYESRLDPG